MKLYISEPHERHAGPILVCDEEHNDIAEFFHNEHATVAQGYETALGLAQTLVNFRDLAEFTRDAIGKRISDGLDDDLGEAFNRVAAALSRT